MSDRSHKKYMEEIPKPGETAHERKYREYKNHMDQMKRLKKELIDVGTLKVETHREYRRLVESEKRLRNRLMEMI